MVTWSLASEWITFTSAVAFYSLVFGGKKWRRAANAGLIDGCSRSQTLFVLRRALNPHRNLARFEFFFCSLLLRGSESRKAWLWPPKDSLTFVRWIAAVFVLSETGNLFYFAAKRNTRTPPGVSPGRRRVIPGRAAIAKLFAFDRPEGN